MKQVGVIAALMILAAAVVMMIGRLVTPAYYSPGALRMESRIADQFDQIIERFPATSPADTGGDVAHYNALVRDGHAIPLPTTRP
jgi:hypothetical protein